MVYIYKEYNHIFDTPAKMEQESVVVNKIMELLNKNKFDSIEDFIQKNQTYQDFLKNNEIENVVKHFGNTLSEDDFKKILNEMLKLTEKKRMFDRKNIKTTNIGDNEYNSYTGQEKTFFLDNSHSNMSIERQMEELQSTQEKFQTSNPEKNTQNMMEELEKEKKESLDLKYLNEIDVNSLNYEQAEIFAIVKDYQLEKNDPLRIDIDRQIIVDKSNNIIKIEKTNGGFAIFGDENIDKNNTETIETKEKKSIQKTLTMKPDTIYSNNN